VKPNNKIRQAAKGETCTLLFPGVGVHDPATVVWAHSPFPGDGKSMGAKSYEFCGCLACHACHDILDSRVKTKLDRDYVRAKFNEAMKRSLIRLWERGIKPW